MIGIILCTHSTFAKGLKSSCEMVMGDLPNFYAVCFDGNTSLTDLGEQLKSLGSQYEDGCIYVVDLLNGTPFNACLYSIAGTENVVLSGASLPMMLELLMGRVVHQGTCRALARQILLSSADYVSMKVAEDIF